MLFKRHWCERSLLQLEVLTSESEKFMASLLWCEVYAFDMQNLFSKLEATQQGPWHLFERSRCTWLGSFAACLQKNYWGQCGRVLTNVGKPHLKIQARSSSLATQWSSSSLACKLSSSLSQNISKQHWGELSKEAKKNACSNASFIP